LDGRPQGTDQQTTDENDKNDGELNLNLSIFINDKFVGYYDMGNVSFIF